MGAASETVPLERSKRYQAILWGGLIAGALDITAAFVTSGLRGAGPIRILQAIASGLLGADYYKGGFGHRPEVVLGGGEALTQRSLPENDATLLGPSALVSAHARQPPRPGVAARLKV